MSGVAGAEPSTTLSEDVVTHHGTSKLLRRVRPRPLHPGLGGAPDLLESSKSTCDFSIGRCPSSLKREDQRVTFEVPSVGQAAGGSVWGHDIRDLRDDVLGSQRRFRALISARIGDEIVICRQPLLVRLIGAERQPFWTRDQHIAEVSVCEDVETWLRVLVDRSTCRSSYRCRGDQPDPDQRVLNSPLALHPLDRATGMEAHNH